MENQYTRKTASFSASFKDADSKKGIVTGYFSAFNNKDSDGDVIVSGAFQKTIEERGPFSKQPRIKHLLNHRPDQPLGKLQTLQEDTRGLYYESLVGTHILGKEFIAMVESELITEHSIGFRTTRKEETNDGTILKEIQLWEGSSLTSWGANEQTPITGMKAEDKKTFLATLIEKHKAIERFCANANAVTDETLESILLYNKQLFQLILDFTKETTTPGDEPTLPDNKAEGQLIADFQSIYSKLKIVRHGYQRSKGSHTAYQ